MLDAEEKEPEVPMELEENEAGYAKKEDTMKISGSNKKSCVEKFNIETNHTPNSRYSNSNSVLKNSNIFVNLDPRIQPIEMESSSLLEMQLNINNNPSLQQIEASSGITRGHGVVKHVLAHAFGN